MRPLGCAAVAVAAVACATHCSAQTATNSWCDFVNAHPGFTQWSNVSSLLAGRELDLVAFHEPPWAIYDPNAPPGWGKGKQLSGYDVELIMAIAAKGNFTIRRYDYRPVTNESWTDALLSVKEQYDLVAGGGWMDTSVRRKLGISFSAGISDHGITLAMMRPQEVTANFWENAFFFVKPFDGNAYPIILAFALVPALLIWFIELERSPGAVGFFESVFMGMLDVLGAGDFTVSRSWFARALQVLFAFACLILTSSYTASLTNFLVAASRPDVDVDGASDFFSMGKVACVPQGWGNVALIRNKWGHSYDAQIREVPAPKMSRYVSEDECAGVLLMNDYTRVMLAGGPPKESGGPEIPYGCNMELVGTTEITGVGAFPAGTSNCRWFLIQVIDSLIRDLDEDGTISSLIEAEIKHATTKPDGQPICPPVAAEPASEEVMRIGAEHLVGLLITTFPPMIVLAIVGLVMDATSKKGEDEGGEDEPPARAPVQLDPMAMRRASMRFAAATIGAQRRSSRERDAKKEGSATAGGALTEDVPSLPGAVPME
eukprot:TRINITY_DN50081_c0_g1_i1.p1 TRINITY_DN50081_c0_g1~~TRINITY_DN50081_c0_g1_i1.p1  ORF type:complete len:544 (+),score=126.74 TRINITY_DN50081_c0_g1_i1:131-1762(+)